MSEYEVSEMFARSCNFLRVRSTPVAGDANNIAVQVPNEQFRSSTWIVDMRVGVDPKYRGWFRVESIQMRDGTVRPGGWVVKEWQGVATLVPKPDVAVERFDDASSAGSRRSRCSSRGMHAGEKQVEHGHADLNLGYANEQFSTEENACLGFANGAIAWEYKCDTIAQGLIVRIVERKVVVADRGHGLDIVRRMEHESVKADPFGTSKRPDVVLFFLHSVPSAEAAHRKHGYTPLWRHDEMPVMYRQVCGGSAFAGRPPLTEATVKDLAARASVGARKETCLCCARRKNGGDMCYGCVCGFNQCQHESRGRRCTNRIGETSPRGHPSPFCLIHR